MASNALRTVIRHLHRLVAGRSVGGLADADLLQRFVAQRDEAAFEVLVWRHGPMVWNVCQRLLHHSQDAEDAFQATFLAFVQEADRIRERSSLGSWLYKVAYRVALKAKARAAQQARRETHGVEMLEAPREDSWQELRPVLDEEVNRLPLKYRLPFVLCYLQGKTTDEVAQELGCPRGTIATRLAWARERLRKRLTQRGLALSSGVLATLLSQKGTSATLSAVLVRSTVRSGLALIGGNMAAGAISTTSAGLAEAVLQAMMLGKWKVTAAALFAASLLAAGAGLAIYQATAQPEAKQEQRQPATRQSDQPRQERANSPRLDRYGDPLPEGALARLGSRRWRTGMPMYSGPVDVLAYALKGTKVACASRYGAWLFDKADGKLVQRIHFGNTLERNFSSEPRFAFSPDGSRLACGWWVEQGRQEESLVQIWDLASGRKLQEFSEAPHLQALHWSVEGQPVAVILDKGVILFHEVATGRERRFPAENLPDVENGLRSCAYAAKTTLLAIPDQKSAIHIWDTTTGEKRCTLRTKGAHARSLVFSPDGRSLASLSPLPGSQTAVELWDATSGKATHTLAADQEYVVAVAFDAEGKLIATIGNWEIRFWDALTGTERGRILWSTPTRRPLSGGPVFGGLAVFSPDGKALVTTERYSGAFHFWDVATGKLKPEYSGHTKDVGYATFSPDGRRVASGGGLRDGAIYMWDAATGESLLQIRRDESVRGCAFSADGRSLFTCWTGNKLHVLDTDTGRALYSLNLDEPDRPEPEQTGWATWLSEDGRTLFAFSFNSKSLNEHRLTSWDTATRKERFRRKLDRISGGTLWANGNVLAKITEEMGPANGPKQLSNQGPIRLEDVATGEEILTFPILEGQTLPLGFSPDGRLLATTTFLENRHMLRLWEVATVSEVAKLPTVNDGHLDACLAFSANGHALALPVTGQAILLWDVRRGKELQRIKGLDAEVTSLAISPDGNRLVSGLSDSTLLVWDVATVRQASKPSGVLGLDPAQAWADLGADARKAFATRAALVESPMEAVSLLKQHLKPAQAVDAQRLRHLLADLDSDRFALRERARKELEGIGEQAKEALKRALANYPSLESRQRIEALLRRLRGPVTQADLLRALRGVAVLEDIATPEAREALQWLAQGAPAARVTQEAKASLERLARRASRLSAP